MNQAATPLAALDHIPRDILCAADYEALAPQFIAAPALAYIAGGSGEERTLRANRRAFARWQILPRLLREVSAGHTRCTVLGRPWRHPIALAPLAYQTLAHPAGEIDTARGAAAADACLTVSTLATCPIEDIARASEGEKWFQLYFQPRRDATRDLIQRAEQAGYRALVVTLDASVQSPSRRAVRAGVSLPAAVNLARYGAAPQRALAADASLVFQGAMREAPTWADLRWLLSATRLPVLVKGVLRADDALALREAGVAGLVVSNHGGRALEGVPASLTALPAIRRAVGADLPVLLDSGVRSGSDVFKALALGASAVLVGRLQVYALSVAGGLGVAHLLRTLHQELELCMAMAGCATLADIDSSLICESADVDPD